MPAEPEWPRSRYLAWLYSPAPQRRLLQSLFGIEREIAASLQPGLDHNVAHSRLQWWREECERCAAGHPIHPLTRALGAAFDCSRGREAIQPGRLQEVPLRALAGLGGLVEMALWDLAGATFERRPELTAYCERWSAAVLEPLCAAVTPPPVAGSATDPGDAMAVAAGDAMPAPGDWRALGAALHELELITHVASEARYGRLRVPLDELERVGADPSVLSRPPWPSGVAQLLADRHQNLRAAIARTLSDLDRENQLSLRGLLVWAALACRISRRAQRELPESARPRRLDAITDGWCAWQSARRATAGGFRLE